ncbi:hypothetical protein L6R50_26990 [Myxococcota bacterium]|nr:hypothetical protein [Myxococcota bacterium]
MPTVPAFSRGRYLSGAAGGANPHYFTFPANFGASLRDLVAMLEVEQRDANTDIDVRLYHGVEDGKFVEHGSSSAGTPFISSISSGTQTGLFPGRTNVAASGQGPLMDWIQLILTITASQGTTQVGAILSLRAGGKPI